MSKPGADPSSGISLGDALRLPKRHPACRRREAQSGSGMERENLAGDAKGKSTSGSNRDAILRVFADLVNASIWAVALSALFPKAFPGRQASWRCLDPVPARW